MQSSCQYHTCPLLLYKAIAHACRKEMWLMQLVTKCFLWVPCSHNSVLGLSSLYKVCSLPVMVYLLAMLVVWQMLLARTRTPQSLPLGHKPFSWVKPLNRLAVSGLPSKHKEP